MTRDEFAAKLEKSRKKLYLAALSVTNNREDAEDAVSNAVLRALKKLSGFTNEDNFDAWMLTVTVNEAKRLRSHKRYYEDVNSLYDVFEDDGRQSNLEFFDILRSAGLNIKCRKIFILKFLYGYSLEEIAKRTGIPASSVRSEYYRGLEKLKKTEGLK